MYIYALVFPYIFLLFDHFKWALIGNIEQQRVPSVIWQFQTGAGGQHQFYLGKSENLNFSPVLHVHHHRSFCIYYTKDLINWLTI